MSGTVRTSAYLLNAFRPGQLPASIVPQSVEDFIVSVYNPLSVVNFGSVGNNSSNPASGVYGSLAALRAVYGTTVNGVTIALTNELDWLAHAKAIDVAAVNGGVVYSPPGNYVMVNSNSVSDGSGTLTFPVAFLGSKAVSWNCSTGAYHHWSNDLGAGKAAVFCAGRGTGGNSFGFFTGLNLIGPGCGSTFGATTCSMQGIMTGDRRYMTNVYVNGFKIGINIVGGQFTFVEVICVGCYYGFYMDTPDSGNFGNFVFIHSYANSCLLAAFAVHHAATIGGSTFIQCFFGTAPFGLYKETNGGSPGNALVTGTCQFIETQFEACGNALVSDDRGSPGARVCQVYQTDFIRCQFMWDTYLGANFHLPGGTAYAPIDIAQAYDFNIIDPVNPEQWQPGTEAILLVQTLISMTFKAEMVSIFNNCINAVSPQVNNFASTSGSPNIAIIHTGIYYWEGTCGFTVANSLTPTTMLTQDTNNFSNTLACSGNTSDVKLGVMMYNPDPPNAFRTCVFANRGSMLVKCSGSVTPGQILRTSSGGQVVAASGTADLTSPIVGFATAADSGGTVGIKLQGFV